MEEKKEVKVPLIFYLHVHNKMRKSTIRGVISRKNARASLFQWRIPKELRQLILKEMELLGLLTPMNKDYYQINRAAIDVENRNEIYECLGILTTN